MAMQKPLAKMTIEELLNRWPQTVQVFHRYKMACVGCPVAPFYTVDDAIKVYDLAREEFLSELEQEIRQMGNDRDEEHNTLWSKHALG